MTGNQGFGRLSQLREQQDEGKKSEAPKPAAAPALEPPTDFEMPDLPEVATQQREVTKLLSAQVPQSKKLAFDRQVLDARAYYPDLEMREGVVALIDLLGDERVRRLWLQQIKTNRG